MTFLAARKCTSRWIGADRLPPTGRALAFGIAEVTELLVHQAARGELQQLEMTLAARRTLMDVFKATIASSHERSCADALFAAVQESEQTLSIVLAQPLLVS